MHYRARVTVFAPASVVSARIGPLVGRVSALSDTSCLLETGSDNPETLATHLGMLGYDFRVDGPPELVDCLRQLAARYQRAIGLTPG